MKGTFTCAKCSKKFEDEVPSDEPAAFSLCLECGNKLMLGKDWEKLK